MDWLGDHAWAAWLGVAAFLGIAELLSLDLVLVMLAVGALGGAVTAAAGGAIVLQLVVAAVVAIGMLAVVRPSLVARLHQGPDLVLGTGKLVGQRATVTERITGLSVGRISLAGETWSAAPYDEHVTIEPGTTVEVFEIRGATAYVHPIPELDS
ncbi:NfeD family protein [Nocardioides sp. YIM 152315]|uniref:NfeD family protein n=1 Tax=Nocardioides sp. YIM 152315 TaxID=3031760 RepID=UPI0023DAD01D|nr:NfeD family protein [Nocardioides sp. YIM 152315]MDF1602391.1 NfeD family protein [Nocardioides sp. YIM 152315]